MPLYVYVIAIVSGTFSPGDIRFGHTIVTARNKDEAYLEGQRELNPRAGDHEVINDYVVEVVED